MSLPSPAPDRTAVVTGASSGIGREIARNLARRGHGVTLVARSVDKLEELAKEISATGRRAEVLQADLSDPEVRGGLLGRITDLGLTADVLVNNAGLSTLGPVAASDPLAEQQMIQVDVMCVADLTSRFLPHMVANHRGAILNVASVGAFQPVPGQAGYGACKAFVLSYTEGVHGELKGTGVSISVLCPGPVDTGFGERAGFTKEEAEKALPKVMWLTAEKVAEVGLDALDKGKVISIPGRANHIAARTAYYLPNRLLVPILARQHPGLRP